MALIRNTIIALIAFAVALLPASANAISLPLHSPEAEVTLADHADMPCCPSCDSQGDFKATACALKCAALASAVLPATGVAPLYFADGSLRALPEDTLHTHVIAPTHPPPI